ncbi:hypothetical protein ACR776_15955 [Sphingobacterium spiritivorum]|uniref:Uncharacterized protein n=1 Tax=Sphingobacterium spiritivorum ATCC 33861 TaxID=525373 RepID=D7VL84_SPHSI|nr:hypothetical protein [Sphingobacterium spiritivorum]EFK58357.1 hypothetical protein HMPREF0766_11753 [Sphingobacterium spiritivorum ATCC 33861]QQT37105.1 hypothetical protein I6J01_06730 [Sphingobacterium spiritivorum]WQD33878.1 hypothetical protein U0038_20445 [Sphingobacterium spiritivorum]SUJ27887.1 Uncharacterised protein [Sphingobacterium spiritivorum]
MKQKLMYFILITGLGFTACKKEDSSIKSKDYKIIFEGKEYLESEVRRKMALVLGFNKDSLVYIPDSVGYMHKAYCCSPYKLEVFMPTLNQIQ